jgi:AcrR family transcriptional regulator
MSTTDPTSAPRRTQEERTAETRRKLLDATLASLFEVGYAATDRKSVV